MLLLLLLLMLQTWQLSSIVPSNGGCSGAAQAGNGMSR